MTMVLQDIISEDDKVLILIDGSNLHASITALGFEIDYKKMLASFKFISRSITAKYYTALGDGDSYSPIRPLVDYLQYNGYLVESKPVKEYYDSITKDIRTKGNMDMEIGVDLVVLGENYDVIVLFSGDGDFTYPVKKIQDKGKRVISISSMKTTPPMMSDELRRKVDGFIELDSIKEHINKS